VKTNQPLIEGSQYPMADYSKAFSATLVGGLCYKARYELKAGYEIKTR
jgi:hypothetical protein